MTLRTTPAVAAGVTEHVKDDNVTLKVKIMPDDPYMTFELTASGDNLDGTHERTGQLTRPHFSSSIPIRNRKPNESPPAMGFAIATDRVGKGRVVTGNAIENVVEVESSGMQKKAVRRGYADGPNGRRLLPSTIPERKRMASFAQVCALCLMGEPMFPASTGGSYSDYEPAYLFGNQSASDERYLNSDWDMIQPEMRKSWEAGGRGPWDKFKDAIRHGWDTVRAKRAA